MVLAVGEADPQSSAQRRSQADERVEFGRAAPVFLGPGNRGLGRAMRSASSAWVSPASVRRS